MKQNYRKKSLKLLLALSLGLCVVHTGYAAPSDGTIASGNGTINGSNITGLSGASIINWVKFSIANGETVNFSGNSPWAVLNRVTGNDISDISGTLNGQGGTVFLVNPNGIVFGNGANINAASFVASTLNIDDNAFTSLANGGTGNFIAGNGAGKINFTGNTNLNNSNATFMGKSIEIDAGVNLTLGNSTSFLAGPNIALTNTPDNGNFNMTSMRMADASPDNSININGGITSTSGNLNLLGGKINIDADVSSQGDMFIAAGNQYSLEKTDGDFWFGYDKMNTSTGNTVNIAQGATIDTTGESAILANSVTNNGAITVADQNGLAMYVLDNLTSTFDASGKPISANVSTSKNNKFTNNGTVTIANGGRFDIMANTIDNQGTITATRGDVVLTGNLSGNAIANTKLQVANDQYTGILMTPDASGEPTYSFINPAQIPEVEKGSALESAINQALTILDKKGATPEEKAQATLDIIKGHATAGVESSKENTKATPSLTANEGASNTSNLVVADNNTSSNLTVEDQEVK